MTAPAGVLAVMDYTVTELVDARMGACADQLAEVRAAVAALIEADREYDAAEKGFLAPGPLTLAAADRWETAKIARRRALARVRGGA